MVSKNASSLLRFFVYKNAQIFLEKRMDCPSVQFLQVKYNSGFSTSDKLEKNNNQSSTTILRCCRPECLASESWISSAYQL